MNLAGLEAELNEGRTLEALEAEAAQPDPAPWDGAMLLPELCPRGHPRSVYDEPHQDSVRCRRCRALLDSGRTLAGISDVWPARPRIPATVGRGRSPSGARLLERRTVGRSDIGGVRTTRL